MRRSKGRLEGIAKRGRALLQGLEDAAAIVIGHHDGEVLRPRLVLRDQQPIGIVQECHIPYQGHHAWGAPIGGIQRLRGQGDANGLGHCAIDAGHPARGVGIHAVKGHTDEGGIAHRIRGAEDHRVIDRKRIAYRRRYVQSGKPELFFLQCCAHGLAGHVGRALANLEPLAAWLPGDLDGGAKARVIPALVGKVRRAREHHQVDIRVIHQREHAAVQRGVAHHDDLLNLGIDHVVIRRDLRLAENVRRGRVHGVERSRRGGLRDGRYVF